MNSNSICLAIAGVGLLTAFNAMAADPEQMLQRSEQLDVRRIGRVSEDERSVLRIEWRVALASAEEARGLQEMMDRLRRLEGTTGEVGRLVRSMPATRPAVVPAIAEQPATEGLDLRLAIANLAAASLVGLWWFRRRKHARQDLPAANPAVAPGAAFDLASAGAEAPLSTMPAPTLTGTTAAGTSPGPETVALRRDGPAAAGTVAQAAAPENQGTGAARGATGQATTGPDGLPQETGALHVDFSLDDADPKAVSSGATESPPAIAANPVAATSQPDPAVDPTLQLAEIMLSMGLEQGAAQALLEYIDANPRHAVYHWLKLLGIYRKKGLHQEFVETAEKLRRHFNIQADDWAKPGSGEVPSLEKFSRVAEHVQTIWARPAECIDYLQHLLEDNREGVRAGFPQTVAEEILFLIEILKTASSGNQAGVS